MCETALAGSRERYFISDDKRYI